MNSRANGIESATTPAKLAKANEARIVSFTDLRLADLEWKPVSCPDESSRERVNKDTINFRLGRNIYKLDCQHQDLLGSKEHHYTFIVSLQDKPGCKVELHICYDDSNPEYASTDVDRLDEEERVLPPGFGPKLLGKVIQFIVSEASSERHIHHEISVAPIGYTVAKWHEKFSEVIDKYNYQPNREGNYEFLHKGM